MKLYVVLNNFRDTQDNLYNYKKDDIYPHNINKVVTNERANDLIEKGFIAPLESEVEQKENSEEEFPKHVGGGYYELSNGEKVKGKEDAVAAENALKSGE